MITGYENGWMVMWASSAPIKFFKADNANAAGFARIMIIKETFLVPGSI